MPCLTSLRLPPSNRFVRLAGAVGLLAAALVQAPTVLAQDHAHGGHADGGEHADDPAVQAYREANDRMHEEMIMGFTGDPDVDFARGMIPHHRGAIDMAKVVLEHGEDEELRALAREIIDAQEAEIEFLRQWLEERGH